MLTPTTAILVGTVALIIFGPKQLPELAKSLGKAMGEFKKGLNGEPDPVQPPAVAIPTATVSAASTTAEAPAPNPAPAAAQVAVPNPEQGAPHSST